MKRIYIDVETTGFSTKTDKIVDIGAIYEKDGEVVDTFQIYIYHDTYPENYTKLCKDVHGLYPRLLRNKGVTESEAFEKFVAWLDKYVNKFDTNDKFEFCAFNAPFDKRHISAMFYNNGNNFFGSYFQKDHFDVLAYVKENKHVELIKNTKNNKLNTIAKALNVELINSHSALSDITSTRNVYIKLKEELEKLL